MESNSNSSASSSKKRSPKEDDDDIVRLRTYILECPLFGSATAPEDHPAIKAALAGLDQELKRRERDRKLQKKFVSSTTTASQAGQFGSSNNSNNNNNTKHGSIEDEWQSIDNERNARQDSSSPPNLDEVEIINIAEGEEGGLGKKLAAASIAAIAESQARAKTPVAALAMALHAAMRSDLLGFACMNSTDDYGDSHNKPSNGFAAPIRELPKTKFLPQNWDKHALGNSKEPQRVVLRYRKNGTGSVLLKVEQVDDDKDEKQQETKICVKLLPATTKEPPSQSLTFSLDRHVNLDSWTAALRSSDGKFGVHPALHYKALPELLESFANTFDLGSILEENPGDPAKPEFLTPPLHATYKDSSCSAQAKATNVPRYPGGSFYEGRNTGYDNTPTIGSAFPPVRPAFVGDFSGDLVPTGGMGGMPGLHNMGPGSLMGPNHPAFRGGPGMPGVGGSSGFGMQPRFDPFGPPGGPQEIHTPDGRPVPPHRGAGNPNPDHLRPPNSFNSDMFS